MTETLSPDEVRRYRAHLLLKSFGGAGQQRLRGSRVLVAGAGGLGSPAIAYLAAAGVGTLGILDRDVLELSNLNRQVVHSTAALGTAKADSAARFVQALNPHTAVMTHPELLDIGNAEKLLAGYDLVLDGLDNLRSRRRLAETARALAIPVVSGAANGFDGQVTVFGPGQGDPGFPDLFPDGVEDAAVMACEAAGILGPVTGVIGTMMAVEAIKLLTGTGEPLLGRLLLYDGLSGRFSEFAYGRPGPRQ